MRRLRMTALAATLALSACATVPAPAPETVAKVVARYDRARAFADLLLPYLPPSRQVPVRAALAVADRAADALRVAATAAEQRRAIARMDAALSSLDHVVDGVPAPPT